MNMDSVLASMDLLCKLRNHLMEFSFHVLFLGFFSTQYACYSVPAT